MGLWRFLRRANWDRERRAEIESYLQIETDENIARGMRPEEARRKAQRKFGNTTLVREEIYRMNSILFLDAIGRDVRYALRALGHNLTFSVVAVLTLALGIGANTAIFSVVNGILIEPLPYPDPGRLIAVSHTAPGLNATSPVNSSPSLYFTYREESRTFQDVGLWTAGGTTVTGLGEPEQVRTLVVTYGTLQALGIQPLMGRLFTQLDDSPGTQPAPVILAYGYWQRKFGGDVNVLGRAITIEARQGQIVGVMPQNFRFPNADPEVIVPLRLDRNRAFLGNFSFRSIARVKPGVTLEQATADMRRMLAIWITAWPAPPGAGRQLVENWKVGPLPRPLKDEVVGDVGNMLWLVMGTVGIVLLIACANVANLMLVRAEGRQQEFSIRVALGASRVRVVNGVLAESLLLGLIGGAAGLALAYAALKLLLSISPASLPRLSEISIDPRVLAFDLAASLAAGLFFGLAPAFKYAGPHVATALRGMRTSSPGRDRHYSQNALVVVQVALALVLLVSSGLMIRTFQSLRRVDMGFLAPEQIQTMRISIPPQVGEAEQVARTQQAILDKLAAIPGVTSAAFSSSVPMDGYLSWDGVWAEDKTYAPGETPTPRIFRYVSPGFFQTAGTRLIAGRDIAWTDVYDYRPVAMVSENFARELWGDPAAALGKRIRQPGPASPPWREIVGVVQDVRNDGAYQKAPSIVYWPALMQNFFGVPRYIVRSLAFSIRTPRAGSESFLNEVRQAVWSVNPNLPLAQVRTMQEINDRSMAGTSFVLVMLGISGAMALVLGIIGIYGVISYAVSQRTREIGIRLALGAGRSELKRMFVRHGLVLAGLGVAIGLAAAAGLTRLMRSLLFGISPLDPLAYAAALVVLVAAALLASYLPARRAAAVDPAETLKAE